MGEWISAGIVFVALFLFMCFLPRKWKVSHQRFLQLSIEDLFDFLIRLKNWPDWQLGDEQDLAFLYVGPEKGEGATQYWESNGTQARLKVTKCEHLKTISYQIRFDQGAAVLEWVIDLTKREGKTQITWTCMGTAKNVIERWFVFFYRWKMRREMKASIDRLQKRAIAIYQKKQIA